ncbi:MAG: threonine--tRNA ligase [Spartobacteria bacterium]|nr:threonine--tRNA ligase [Spartobacteria bacterium]
MKNKDISELELMRHSAAHVMAAAVCRLFEDVKLDIGPSTETGFYYDFDIPQRVGPDDFERIEAEMQRIVDEDLPFERLEMTREEATKKLTDAGQHYKIERLADIPEGESITFYQCGDFFDLCRGPHVASTKAVKAFKLLSVAGSYYRGIETNPMLQRIYATAFTSSKALRAHLKLLEEAKKRDHRKIGKELDLFSTQDAVGPGLVHWHPKGARIRSIIEEFWRKLHYRNGYEMIYTPHVGQANLWETSGHLDFYRESMYSSMDVDGMEYFIKPMNCPFHIKIYNNSIRSYRELPIRWAELGTVYRYEKAGVLHGLMRVRGFTQDDAHIMCTPEQVEQEIKETMQFAIRMWNAFGFKNISAYLATRPEKAVGDDVRWEQATKSLEAALISENIPYETDPGGGAFYGPKIDMKVKDAIGREWQVSTIQFDFNLPERFDMTYVGEDGKPHRPYMVHRALLGSLERFFGILIEHYAGAFPLWLAPEQLRILPLTQNQLAYAEKLKAAFLEQDIRVTVDTRQEKIGAKIRLAQMEKIPYMAVVGPKEEEAGVIALRNRTKGDQGQMSVETVMAMMQKEIETKGLDADD